MLRSVPTAWPVRPIGVALVISSCLLALGLPALTQAAKTDAAAARQKQQPLLPAQVRYGTDGLPPAVLNMREALLAAIEAGELEELRHAFAESGIEPDIGAPAKTDPIAHWRGVSGDGQGRDVLAALSLILDAGYAVVRRGADIENNQLYVWPYFAEIALDKLTPRQEVELLRLVPAGVARTMKEGGKYTHWRLVIGADGTWHALRKED